jgi:hypothetical protein
MVDLFESAIERAVGVLSEAEVLRVAEKLFAQQKLHYDDVCALISIKPPWDR